MFGEQINDLALAFITPMRTDDYDYFGHRNQRTVNSKQLTADDRRIRTTCEMRLSAVGCPLFARQDLRSRCSGDVFVDHARNSFFRSGAHHAFFFFATLEKNQRGDSLDAVALRD